MSRTLPRLPAEPRPIAPITPARSTGMVALKPRVAAFGDELDRARWGAILAAECAVVHWYATVAEALVDLRMQRFHAIFIPSDAAFARALVHTLTSLPVVVAALEPRRVLEQSGHRYEVLRSRTDFARAVRTALVPRTRIVSPAPKR